MTKFKIPFRAVAQGSHRAFIVKCSNGYNKAVVTDNNKQSIHSERVAIAEEYHKAGGMNYGSQAMKMDVTFSFIRPKTIKEKKRPYMTVKPDLDKLLRCVIDGLTTHAYTDDSQIVQINSRKIYSDEEYIEVEIEPYIQQVQQTL